jgi:nucleotide-binding universal stress UspA family protein
MKHFVVLVAIDFSTAGEAAIRRALELAAAYPWSEVHVVTVEPFSLALAPAPVEVPHVAARLREMAAESVARFEAARSNPCAAEVTVHVVHGRAADAVVELAAELRADLVLVGSHGRRGIARALHGSVAEHVVRRAHCPVLVVREPRGPTSDEDACAECDATRVASGGRERRCSKHARAEVGT